MRYPEFIKKGDRIGYTAPSMGATTEPYASCFAKALEVMAERGYGHEIGKNVYKDDGIGISTNPKAAAEELVELYLSKENQALISTGGGEMMCELLPYVDWEKIKAGKPRQENQSGILAIPIIPTLPLWLLQCVMWQPSMDHVLRPLA